MGGDGSSTAAEEDKLMGIVDENRRESMAASRSRPTLIGIVKGLYRFIRRRWILMIRIRLRSHNTVLLTHKNTDLED